MEIKSNESTINRPKGERLIDAPFVTTNLASVIDQLKEEEAWSKNSRNAITVFKSEGFSMVLIGLHKDAVLTDNEATEVVCLQVLKGSVQLAMGEEPVLTTVEAGNIISIHRLLSHPVTALEDSFLLMTMTGE